MTTRIHTNGNYTNVGMLEILNEPLQRSSQTETLIPEYYTKAYSTIRDAEATANVAAGDALTVQAMVDTLLTHFLGKGTDRVVG